MNRTPRTFTVFLILSLALSIFCVAYPIYVIRPFRHQGATELAFALSVSRFRPAITVITAVAALLALIGYWRIQPSKWWRTLATAAAAGSLVLAFLARVNIYEMMFHPIIHPSFTPAGETKLNSAEKVIAVRIHGEARAYPIRSMSYHHVVNDVLGGTALVATY